MKNLILSKLLYLNVITAIQPPVPEYPGSCRDYGYLMEKIGRLEEKVERLEKTDFKNNFFGQNFAKLILL